MVKRRCVFFIGGYDPKTPEAFFDRLAREMRRFEATWNATGAIEKQPAETGEVGSAVVTASQDENWHVTTDFHFLTLDSVVARDFARPLPVRLLKYLVAFLDYVLTGTALRMFLQSWRFGLYFLYPFVVTLAFFLVALAAISLVLRSAAMDLRGLGLLLALLATFPLLATLGRRWSIPHLMDLWSFSLNYLRGRRPDADALMEHFAATVVERVAAKPFDEILLIGHSTGGGLILDVAARSLRINPDLARSNAEVSILTLGSTALKLGMHPAARDYRRGVQSLVDEPNLKWVEYQCMIDVINFYRSDPVRGMKLKARPSTEGGAFPIVRTIHMKSCLDAATYKRIRRNFFRIHYQFIFGNTQRYFYDFFMICFGPLPLSRTARSTNLEALLAQEPAR